MRIDEIHRKEDNPRLIKDERFKKLCQSIKEFPKMMALRPIIYDEETKEILGGNMRHKALEHLGYTEIPDEWVKSANELTEDEKKRFIVQDNIGFGQFDYDILSQNYDMSVLNDWGLEFESVTEKIIDEADFEARFNAINDDDALYPIVPKPDEDAEMFVIISHSEMDSNWLREKLNMKKMKSYKESIFAKSNVISIEDLKDVL